MGKKTELPAFIGKTTCVETSPTLEQRPQIFWKECEDVYKPKNKKISKFQAERGIAKDKVNLVYIEADALANLKAHSRSNLQVEQGGILFGNAYEDPELRGIYVEITAAVAALATVGTRTHLEFTPSSWSGIMNYAGAEYPQENIVGWYHSHPNIGVFMSRTDMKTQRAFFYHPWCLSIVYDPVRDDTGFFLGESAQRVKPVMFKRIKQPKPWVEQHLTVLYLVIGFLMSLLLLVLLKKPSLKD